METKRFNVAAEIKAVDDSGIIEGYGSVFGNLDSYSDIVAPGAFAKSLEEAKASGRMPAMLWQHNQEEPIGVWTEMREDDRGLFVKGKLADTQRGKEARELIKLGALTGLSIGYTTRSYQVDRENDSRVLTDVQLWEVSPVTFPANSEARITGVKASDISSPKDFERFLRDAGFSRKEAKQITAHGFGDSDLRDVDPDDAAEIELADHIKRAVEQLTRK
jgi:HK97 family phage prohead protease